MLITWNAPFAFRDYAAWFDVLWKISGLNIAFECPKNENGSETFICSKVLKLPYETWNIKMRFDRNVLSCTNTARTYDIFRKMQNGCAKWCINRFDFTVVFLWLDMAMLRDWMPFVVARAFNDFYYGFEANELYCGFQAGFVSAILHRQFLPQSTFNLFLIISLVQRIYDYIYCRSLFRFILLHLVHASIFLWIICQ